MKRAVVLISANAEWRAVLRLIQVTELASSPYGDYFSVKFPGWKCQFIHAGWGKIAAAASTQYAIDYWSPDILINLGTCGGFFGEIERGEIVLVEKTIVYDILEQMGDFEEHIAHYTTELDLSWLKEPYPIKVRRTLLVSGDRDIIPSEVHQLKTRFQACAGDWESGAIAWTAARNNSRLLILRGVTDLVEKDGSLAYGSLPYFEFTAFEIMEKLVNSLPAWLKVMSF